MNRVDDFLSAQDLSDYSPTSVLRTMLPIGEAFVYQIRRDGEGGVLVSVHENQQDYTHALLTYQTTLLFQTAVHDTDQMLRNTIILSNTLL